MEAMGENPRPWEAIIRLKARKIKVQRDKIQPMYDVGNPSFLSLSQSSDNKFSERLFDLIYKSDYARI